ncbi:hypothetical protein G9A89_007662 [Geosiphon pyriformis]|nr:hypothetical protein G9A89_007662 [Geosiphon pyriformis]
MVYTSIVKLKKFTGEEKNAQVWLNNIKKTIVANDTLQNTVTYAKDFELAELKARQA